MNQTKLRICSVFRYDVFPVIPFCICRHTNLYFKAGLPFPLLAYLVAVAVELGGGALLVAGFQTRIVGIVLAIFTVAAALSFHHNFADQNQMVHFLKNIAFTGGLLQVVAFGAGRFSVDGQLANSRGVSL